jgi:hypothetical protein
MKIIVKKVNETVENTLNKENVLCTIEFEIEHNGKEDAGICQGRFLHDVLEDMQVYMDHGNVEVTDEMTNYFRAEMLTLHLND